MSGADVRWHIERTHFLCVILIFIACAFYLHHWPKIWDIQLWDETFNLADGVATADVTQIHYEGSPLYSFLYTILSFFCPQRTDLYYLTALVTVVGAIMSIFIAGWVVSRSLFFAVVIFYVYLLTGFLMIVPRSPQAAIIVLLSGSALVFSLKFFPARVIVLTFVTLLAALTRPEFVLAFYLCAALSLACLVQLFLLPMVLRRRSALSQGEHRELMIALASLGALVLTAIIFSVPVLRDNGRAVLAFAQHFSVYWALHHNLNDYAWRTWDSIINDVLPGAKTEFEALLRYPNITFGFLFFNIESIFAAIRANLLKLAQNHAFVLAISGLTIACFVVWLRARHRKPPAPRADLPPFHHDLILWLILVAPSAAAVILIYAEPHYLISCEALAALGAALLVRRLPHRMKLPQLLPVIAALVLLPSIQPAPAVPRRTIATLATLAKAPYLGRMLEDDGGWCLYLSQKCLSIYPFWFAEQEDLVQILDSAHIQTILASPDLVAYAKTNKQTALLQLIDSPEAHGWTRQHLAPDITFLSRTTNQGVFTGGNTDAMPLLKFIKHATGKITVDPTVVTDDASVFVQPQGNLPVVFDLQIGKLARAALCRRLQLFVRLATASSHRSFDIGVRTPNAVLYAATVTAAAPLQQFVFAPVGPDDVVTLNILGRGPDDRSRLNVGIYYDDCPQGEP